MTDYRVNEEFCPFCKTNLQGDPIPKDQQHLFGATHFSRKIGIEILGGYDGISYWKCPDCKSQWDRWTGKIIKD